jgi:uncharacterized protein (TIGR03083 family)
MQLNHERFEDLVGAYALDACDDDETVAVEAYVATHPDAGAEVERLRAAAAWLGASGSLVPPSRLRAVVLERAVVAPASGVDAYTELTDRLDDALGSLAPDALEHETHNGLTVRQLVAHLTAIDDVFLAQVTGDGPRREWIDAATIVDITEDALARTADRSFGALRDDWRRTRDRLRGAVSTAPDRDVMGYGTDDAMLIRAFETWTHLDDVRRTVGEPGYVPSAPALRAMADLSLRILPFALAATDRAHPGESVRMVLTGPGGKAWNVPLAPGETPAEAPGTAVTIDIVEWCLRFSDRIEPGAVRFDVEGDRALAADVLAAAPAFAGL